MIMSTIELKTLCYFLISQQYEMKLVF